MKAFFHLPVSLASLVLAQAASPAVYIFMPSNTALTVMSSALNTLGYSYAESTATGDVDLGLDPSTYTILAPGTEYRNISQHNPGARFILPTFTKGSYSWLGVFSQEERVSQDLRSDDTDSIRSFFADMEEAGSGTSQLLELDMFSYDSHTQAQTWVTLCDFLGLGYSVVERLKLWRFPQ
ncbi:hypothetical protein GQX73_g10041 [Xylaria multiplex]|uniref:Uncharacterized protein n=1 Tax=Xylaria multiplex TaxID=323545 RepID=A0A7C8ILP7_9PEZI|nr:hypothetical protein GQX73_g10041 [Xylaria multiplex]